MKPLTLAVASLLFITFTVNAQSVIKKTPKLKYTKQGTFEVGGEIFFNSSYYHREVGGPEQTQHDDSENILTLKANAGIFVIDGLKLGIEPAVTIQYHDGSHSWTQLKLYFSPEYVRYTNSIAYPYIGALIGYTFAKSSSGIGTYSPVQDGFSFGARMGLKVNLFGSSLLNIGLAYYRETYNYTAHAKVKQHYDIIGITLGWSVFF